MKGLIIKDFYTIIKQARFYITFIVLYGIIAFVTKNASMLLGVIGVFGVMLCISSMGYDERSKWDKFALTMPIKRKDIVLSKYAFGFICVLIGGICTFVIQMLMGIDIFEACSTTFISSAIYLLMLSMILPCIFYLGTEKGRLAMIIIMLLPILLLTAFMDKIDVQFLINIGSILSILVTIVSIFLSIKIYERKEI